MRICYLLFIGLIIHISGFAQKPEITSVDRRFGSMEQIVTLKGSNFGSDISKINVFFGATKGTLKTVTDQLIEVRVPFGATYDHISVTNIDLKLTGYARSQFLLSYSGASDYDVDKLSAQLNFPTTPPVQENLNDLCTCDFNADGKPDVATASRNSLFVNIYPNNSTGPGTILLGTRFNLNATFRTLQVRCRDLDGDGRPDIVATETQNSANRVVIFRKTNANDYAFTTQTITVPGRSVAKINLVDVDLDGKPDIILSSPNTNSIIILRNTSSGGTLTFAAPFIISVNAVATTDGLAVTDLNGDRYPEIVTARYQDNSDVVIIPNNSSPGTLSFGTERTITIGTFIKNITAADFDNDGKTDLALSQFSPSRQIRILPNTSTSSTISFGTPINYESTGRPDGLGVGDLDGDGKPDLVCSGIDNTSFTILNNASSPGSISFVRKIKAGLTYTTQQVNLADMDSDGKPDVVFASIDFPDLAVIASKVSIMRNSACMVPVISPEGPLNFCSTLPVELTATKGQAINYTWTNISNSTSAAGTEVFTPTVSGTYRVNATSTVDVGCNQNSSNTVQVVISPGSVLDPNPVVNANNPVCQDTNPSLTVTNVDPNATYKWTGPGFSSNLASPVVPNIQPSGSGEYTLEVMAAGGCVAKKVSLIIKVYEKPSFKALPASEILCAGIDDFKPLTIDPVSNDYTYAWFRGTTNLGASGTSYLAGTTGEYHVKATSTVGCGVSESTRANLLVATSPTVQFSIPSSVCVGQELVIQNTSTVDANATVNYKWEFSDGTSATGASPAPKIFNQPNKTELVKLTISYGDNKCTQSASKSVVITSAPVVTISNPDGKYDLCPGGSLELTTGTFTSYKWNTGETTPLITVGNAGTYTVEVVTSNGCILKTSRIVGAYPNPSVAVKATPSSIDEGQQTQLFAEGLLNYSWQPSDALNNASIQNPLATPLITTLFTVTGLDPNGCTGTGSIEVFVRGEAIVSKLFPKNFFTPNGDAFNPFWTIGEIENYPQCRVVIYDEKGVKVFDAKPYMNSWDGTFNGRRLPDGVYYFIIRCDGEENKPRSGSINLLR